jgi:hypothetical protein
MDNLLPPDPLALPKRASRRRLLQAGAAPVLLTLVSRPVLAGQCVTCSAWNSLTHASHQPNLATCSGLTADAWVKKSWPSPYIATSKDGTPTDYVGTITRLNGPKFADKKMMEVMKMKEDGGYQSLGRHISAALLNARLGLTPVLREATVQNMWNDYLARGYYEPTAGVRWGPAEIVTYIKSTMA